MRENRTHVHLSVCRNCLSDTEMCSVLGFRALTVEGSAISYLRAALGFSAGQGQRSWLYGVHSRGNSYQWTAQGQEGRPQKHQQAAVSSCPFSVSSGLRERDTTQVLC